MAKKFQLGEQPAWLNTAPAEISVDVELIQTLLNESPTTSLIHRGYCLIELDSNLKILYAEFHNAFELFCRRPLLEKQKFAIVQFDTALNSPNQFHGYSEVSQLKSQFMIRSGHNDAGLLPLPRIFKPCALQVFHAMDLLCRNAAHNVCAKLNLPNNLVDDLLDPLHPPSGFISSSILDNFHYQSASSNDGDNRFLNNHAAHTDSGLMTCVVCTDTPGLEVFDSKLQVWFSIEKSIHEFAQQHSRSHRDFAILFWGDSVQYLNSPQLAASLHRVEKLQHGISERFSVVFKQRTNPLHTAPRYQEDYVLIDYHQRRQQPWGFQRMWIFCLLLFGCAATTIVKFRLSK